jgi:hypothetical protein
MTFGRLLHEKKDAIAQRWLDDVLATYPEDASAAYKRQKDPFANPVGAGLRVGTQGIVDALLNGVNGADDERTRQQVGQHLDGIVRIRAVQQFSASQALSFVFRLKEAVRTELGAAAGDSRFSAELAELERRIDQVALAGFDVFVKCREQVSELRVNEAKRQVSWVLKKLGQRGLRLEPPCGSAAGDIRDDGGAGGNGECSRECE